MIIITKFARTMTLTFWYGVKPQCAATRVSTQCRMESRRTWLFSWESSVHQVGMRGQKDSRMIAGDPCSISDMSGKPAGKRTRDHHRPSKKDCTILATCDSVLSYLCMECRVDWRRVSTSGSTTILA